MSQQQQQPIRIAAHHKAKQIIAAVTRALSGMDGLAFPNHRPAHRQLHQAVSLAALMAGIQARLPRRQEHIRTAAQIRAKLITAIVMPVISGTDGIAKRKPLQKMEAVAGARTPVIQGLSVM